VGVPVISFTLQSTDRRARAGILDTPHGSVETPVFMPVGTQATVKTLSPADLHAAGASMILGNAYHLLLRPGPETIRAAGGLHRFMAWDGPILTDSGGYQVFSLGHLRRITDEEVRFRSHLDGSEHALSPESSVRVQETLGADVIMAFDEPPPPDADRAGAERATERTHRWLERCLAARETDQALFGICQGGMFEDLRRASAAAVARSGTPGCAIGGLSVGEEKAMMWTMLDASLSELPSDKPRYLMGVGSPEDLVEGVRRGVDMFDCVLATRLGRNGALFTPNGRVNIRNARFARHFEPVDPVCDCESCTTFTAAYLHHLFRAEEMLGYRLATLHNVRFLTRLMSTARDAIAAGRYDRFADAFLTRYQPTSESVRTDQKARWTARFNRSSQGQTA
jgi:queuine tRNA-ribosyltransferase